MSKLDESEFFLKISKKYLFVNIIFAVFVFIIFLYCASIIENETIKILVIIASILFMFKHIRNDIIFVKKAKDTHKELIKLYKPKEYLRIERRIKLKKIKKISK